jgi:putative Mg2+ transporter-C (MgtC) family protein
MDSFWEQIDFQWGWPLLLSVVLGGLIGLERELHRKPAGLRTNILICLGATVFTQIGFDLHAGYEADIAKLLAGVITGVGFIGAGVLIQDRGGIHGLTSAATIWLVTAIGILCGLERFIMALGITVTVLFILWVFNVVDSLIYKHHHKKQDSN